jgi:hypothetical protein
MVVFESILITFEASVVFLGSLDIIENVLEPKTKAP